VRSNVAGFLALLLANPMLGQHLMRVKFCNFPISAEQITALLSKMPRLIDLNFDSTKIGSAGLRRSRNRKRCAISQVLNCGALK
jgi:hypothetical protein